MELKELEKRILKEFNRQQIRANVIGVVMNSLDDNNKKNLFLDYMINNRNILLTEYDIFNKLNEINCR